MMLLCYVLTLVTFPGYVNDDSLAVYTNWHDSGFYNTLSNLAYLMWFTLILMSTAISIYAIRRTLKFITHLT